MSRSGCLNSARIRANYLQEIFKDRFSASWINSQRVTLVIFNVPVDDNGTFACEATSFGGSVKTWRRNIQVIVLGKFCGWVKSET